MSTARPPMRGPTEAAMPRGWPTPGELMSGLPTLYSYNLVSHTENTCGHAAIASLWDFFGRNPYNLPKTSIAEDGRPHFNNDALVGRIQQQYPATVLFNNPLDQWKPISAVVRETLIRAFQDQGLHCEEAFPAAFSDGHEARQWLIDWLQRVRLPVITLVDLKTLGENPEDFIAHWGVVYSVSATHVRMASWHMLREYPWELFMAAWKMNYLPYPNNFYQLRVWP